jgi:hypothetical protein
VMVLSPLLLTTRPTMRFCFAGVCSVMASLL